MCKVKEKGKKKMGEMGEREKLGGGGGWGLMICADFKVEVRVLDLFFE